jgi:hypothetical protein
VDADQQIVVVSYFRDEEVRSFQTFFPLPTSRGARHRIVRKPADEATERSYIVRIVIHQYGLVKQLKLIVDIDGTRGKKMADDLGGIWNSSQLNRIGIAEPTCILQPSRCNLAHSWGASWPRGIPQLAHTKPAPTLSPSTAQNMCSDYDSFITARQGLSETRPAGVSCDVNFSFRAIMSLSLRLSLFFFARRRT